MERLILSANEWLDVSFLHWRFPPEAVQRLLPAGVAVDTFDGDAWVGLVLLRMRVGPPLRSTPRPGLRILEANLRTYVVGPDGTPGVHFLSIDCDSWPVILGGRAVGVRYFPARMHMSKQGEVFHYRGRRRLGGPASYDVSVSVGGSLHAGALESWLTARWSAVGAAGPVLLSTSLTHEPWPLRSASVTAYDESVLAAAGLPPTTDEPLVFFSTGVTDAVLRAPRRPRAAAAPR